MSKAFSNLDRRSLIGRSLAALVVSGPALTAAVTGSAVNATAATTTDPILAAMENHRSAVARSSAACNAMMEFVDGTPAHIEAEKAYDAALDVADNAALAFANIKPITLAGVIALLTYVDEFNRGAVRLDVPDWNTDHYLWPDTLIDDDVINQRGQPLNLPFAFWLLRNVQAALQSIAVQS